MRKSKLTLGIVAGLACIMALAACDKYPVYSPEGYILSYTAADGEVRHYTAEDLLGSYYHDSASVSTMFDSVYKLIVRNYFNMEGHEEDLAEIRKNADNDVEGVKEAARQAADKNKTKYDDEFKKLIKDKGAVDEDDLREKFIYDREHTKFEDQFYENNLAHLRDSRTDDAAGDKYRGYLQAKVPFHVRHILIKVSDTGSNNYYNAEISKDDAKNLYNVVRLMAEGHDSFGSLAKSYSQDGSASSYGDLGIMDKDKDYVNEFKLGLYAYEGLYNANTKELAAASAIALPEGYAAKLGAIYPDGIGTIPYGAFKELDEMKDVEDLVTASGEHLKVNNGNAFFFPRNVIFNKYMNKHDIAVITPNDVKTGTYNSSSGDSGEIEGEDEKGTSNSAYENLAGFKTVPELNGLGKILCDEKGNPIIVVRAGSGSGEEGYQGLHFITVIRDGLIDTVNDVSLSDYYTTKYPGQEGYPKDADGHDLATYVNYLSQDTKGLKKRADEVIGKIKGFDRNLDKYIYRKYFEEQKIVYADEKMGEMINEYIDRTIEKAGEDEERAWEKTWRTYLESLEEQAVERRKRLSEVCAIKYNVDDEEHTKLFKEGGLCGENVKK